jgi:hypothetical protein
MPLTRLHHRQAVTDGPPTRCKTRAALLCLGYVLAVAGCASSTPGRTASPPASATPAPSPAPAPQTPAAADAVALAAVQAALAWDTRLDHRPNDTIRRLALAYLTPALRKAVLTMSADTDPGHDWADWTRRHAHAAVTVRLGTEDHPDDTNATAYRQVLATITLTGDDGWQSQRDYTAFLRLDTASNSWHVSTLNFEAAATLR